jgi:nucleotide-binding universal stress UspA family protein
MGMYDYRTVVVGTDGSDLASPTVSRAAWIAAHSHSELVVVCAHSDLTPRQEVRTVGIDTRLGALPDRTAANAAMATAVGLAEAQGATVAAALLVESEPAAALLATARDRAADLIVVGAYRSTGIAERLLGSVAAEVVRRAACEVLVVRPRGG